MTIQHWIRVLEDAASLGCKSVQFIGGEPTTHPSLNNLIRLATELEMNVEVYTNLVSVKSEHWATFQSCHVNIATSFYSKHKAVHEDITSRQQSFDKTVANIQKVLSLGLPLRVGLINMKDDQDIVNTKKFLVELGVKRIGIDEARGVGRGSTCVQVTHPNVALCGACTRGKAAVTPDGQVFPCVFACHLPIGNVLEQSLTTVLSSVKMRQTRQDLNRYFVKRFQKEKQAVNAPCMPETEQYLKTQDLSDLLNRQNCEPYECNPNCEPGESNPDVCQPHHLCLPDYMDPCNPEALCSPDRESCAPEWDSIQ